MAKKTKKVKDKQRAKLKARKMDDKKIQDEVLYICTECGEKEYIPRGVVETFDEIDDENIFEPPTFSCEICRGIMRPEK